MILFVQGEGNTLLSAEEQATLFRTSRPKKSSTNGNGRIFSTLMPGRSRTTISAGMIRSSNPVSRAFTVTCLIRPGDGQGSTEPAKRSTTRSAKVGWLAGRCTLLAGTRNLRCRRTCGSLPSPLGGDSPFRPWQRAARTFDGGRSGQRQGRPVFTWGGADLVRAGTFACAISKPFNPPMGMISNRFLAPESQEDSLPVLSSKWRTVTCCLRHQQAGVKQGALAFES